MPTTPDRSTPLMPGETFIPMIMILVHVLEHSNPGGMSV